jgi:hypothetical protein
VRELARTGALDRELTNTWKDVSFEPYVIGGCRMRACIHAPFAFSSDYSLTRREIEVKPVLP